MGREMERLRRARAHLAPAPAAALPEPQPQPAWQLAARRRALALPNRGPIELDPATGRLAPRVLDALNDLGFYVFTGVASPAELADLRTDLDHVLGRSATIERHDRGHDNIRADADARIRTADATIDDRLRAAPDGWFGMAPPLSDPDGGLGRSPSKMQPGTPADGAPEMVMRSASRFFEYSEAGIRLYGHPRLLAVGASICGEDFAPDGGGESIQIKLPGLGPAVAWHQDGTTHWEDDGSTADHCSHGFNFMLQLTGCDETNAVYVLPGSHATLRRFDIPALLEAQGVAGGDVLADAVPIIAGPGDVAVCFRNALHCSFPNASQELRVTFNFGFHKREWVEAEWGADTVAARRTVVPIAMNSRRERFPEEEKSFQFRAPHPYAGREPSGVPEWQWDGWGGAAGRAMATPRLSL